MLSLVATAGFVHGFEDCRHEAQGQRKEPGDDASALVWYGIVYALRRTIRVSAETELLT